MNDYLSNFQSLYSSFSQKADVLRKRLGRPLTLSEKILAAHAENIETQEFVRGESYLSLRPDRVAMQDATAQMAILQFMLAQRKSVAAPTTIHCDHLILARQGAEPDTRAAFETNREVYDFLRSAAKRYGMGFWEPGAGIIHQVVLENYAFPGGLMIGTDSHTPNAGGLGMLAIGVGGADAADVMAGLPWEVKCPKLIGVHLKGNLTGWASAKDVILKLCQVLTVKGGTDKIVEYFGPGAQSISCTGKGTITNMGAELGATTSVFPYDKRMSDFLRLTGNRIMIADLAEANREFLVADPEVEKDPKKFYDEVIEIDLSTLEPHVTGPHTPDLARPVSQLARDVKEKGYPVELRAALIGSCTNSSYEDIGRAAHVAAQAAEAGLRSKVYFLITPGSDQIQETIRRDGQLQALESIGGTVLANACGPCIGQWKRDDIKAGEKNSIINSFNRNFPARNDGNTETLSFIASPEIVTAYALAGRLDIDPTKERIQGPGGKELLLKPPFAPEMPRAGYVKGEAGYIAPMAEAERVKIEVAVSPTSDRLQKLAPFPAWDGKDFLSLYVLLKAQGKCTTDHISPAGMWLKYRGHLDRISDNMFLGAKNAFTKDLGTVKNWLDGGAVVKAAAAARAYKAAGLSWAAVGDENYGEGSSREHAAMSPRWLGAKAVIAKSFARIHETNLKKQGVLALRFEKTADYDRILEDDRLSITGLSEFAPGKPLTLEIVHAGGSKEAVRVLHSFTDEQIDWFKSGSALNLMKGK
jgi:aconitate hydratase